MIKYKKDRNGMRIKKTPVYVQDTLTDKKALKQQAKDDLLVENNNVEFDADINSMLYMTAVSTVANYKFNEAVSAGESTADAFDAVYKATVNWKGADNEVHTIQVKTVIEAVEKALSETASIVID